MDVNLKGGIIYVTALGNNTLEVVDLTKGQVIHNIGGLDEPQGVGYTPQTGEVVVANAGTGDWYFYNARTFEKVATIHLGSDADDVRYDSAEQKIYIGYRRGGITVIDAATYRQVGDIKLPAHPESFQLNKGLHRLFVNLPDANIVGEADLRQSVLLGKWENGSASANFPMALDTGRHQVLVGYRHPARLAVYDGRSVKVLSSGEMTGDADDLYYDSASGEGACQRGCEGDKYLPAGRKWGLQTNGEYPDQERGKDLAAGAGMAAIYNSGTGGRGSTRFT